MGSETVLRFHISLREQFYSVIFLSMTRKYNEKSAAQISAVFDPFSLLTVEQCSETGFIRHLSNHVFRSP